MLGVCTSMRAVECLLYVCLSVACNCIPQNTMNMDVNNCDIYTGQCRCKHELTVYGLHCEWCRAGHYLHPLEGCTACDNCPKDPLISSGSCHWSNSLAALLLLLLLLLWMVVEWPVADVLRYRGCRVLIFAALYSQSDPTSTLVDYDSNSWFHPVLHYITLHWSGDVVVLLAGQRTCNLQAVGSSPGLA